MFAEEVAYWRKANAIHAWFVDNVQGGEDDCATYDVSADQLRELLADTDKVLGNPSLAPTVLPTQSGFFFGPTDYDEYYFESLRYTKTTLEGVLTDEDGYFQYFSSW